MSILNASLITPAQSNAQAILTNIQSLKTAISGVLADSLPRINQETLDALGTNSASLFAELEALDAYATARLTANGDAAGLAELTALTSRIPAVTVNADGTVTINAAPVVQSEPFVPQPIPTANPPAA
jgi:hypothetical protein